MAERLDLEKHRQSITERLTALSKDIEHQSQGSRHLAEFTMLLQTLLENVEERAILNQADLLLFQKLILANARLSDSWEEFKDRCLKLEQQLGFYK